jgi:hypothetical protein
MSESKAPNNAAVLLIAVIVIALLGGLLYWYNTSAPNEPQITPTPTVTAPEPVAPKPQPAPKPAPQPAPAPEPQPAAPEPEPKPEPEPVKAEVTLPPLDSSDEFIGEQLKPNIKPSLLGLIVPDELARKTVRAVIGVSDNRLVNQYRPVRSPLPTLKVEQINAGLDAKYRLTDDNFKRYERHLKLMESIEPATLASLYQDMAPIFNEAYAEQGLDGNFKEVALNAIDNLLATPEVNRPLTLERPGVMYTFADPALEALPDPQKLMLRIGPKNRKRVEAYLQELKAELEKVD